MRALGPVLPPSRRRSLPHGKRKGLSLATDSRTKASVQTLCLGDFLPSYSFHLLKCCSFDMELLRINSASQKSVLLVSVWALSDCTRPS